MLEHPTSCLDKQRYKSLKLVFKPSILGKKTFLERLWKAVSQTSKIFPFFMVATFSWSVENFTLFLPLVGAGGGGGTPYDGLYGKAPSEKSTIYRLQVYHERARISLFWVNNRLGKSVVKVFKQAFIVIFRKEAPYGRIIIHLSNTLHIMKKDFLLEGVWMGTILSIGGMRKRYLFSQNRFIKWWELGSRGEASPGKTLLSTPRVPSLP